MSFSTKGVNTEEKRGVSQFLSYGLNMAALTGFEARGSRTGKKMINLNFEGPKITEEGFQAHQDAKMGGKIGRVQFTIYVDENNADQVKEIVTRVGIIADKLGVREKVDAVEAADLESYFKAVLPILRGKYAWWAITAEEYVNAEQKVRYNLGLRRFGFIASMEEGEGHLNPFDKSNPYDYKAVAAPSKDPDVDPVTEAFGPEPENELPWD